jgi:hypothetical protein
MAPCISNSVAASCTVEADHGGWQLDAPMVFQAVHQLGRHPLLVHKPEPSGGLFCPIDARFGISLPVRFLQPFDIVFFI